MIRRFRLCGHGPGALTPEDQAIVDQFRAMLAAMRDPEPWTPGRSQDIAVRIGPFIERAHPRPGDDHGTEMIAVALVHPDTPHAAAYRHARRPCWSSSARRTSAWALLSRMQSRSR
ncbi:hypothetical protein ACH4UM_37445 [Streptomyces sp. NPDC020801]|uniref:hypothetical protein n=1 Tax=unclassified Streptomyces TaxID=2593676 RepID=UPI0037873289